MVGEVGESQIIVNVPVTSVPGCDGSNAKTFGLQHLQRSDMVGEVGESEIVVNVPVTSVPGCDGSNAKTFGLQHLQFLDMGTSGGPPNGTRIVHHGTDELLIQQNTIPD